MKGKTQKWLKKLSAKRMTIGFGCLAGFAALILLVVLLINASKETDYILFQRDHEIFYYDLSEDKPQQITRKLYDHVDQPQNRDIQQRWADAHADFCTLSQDGKILFFLDRLDDSSFGISLYYRYVEKPEMDPLKISSNVSSYEVNQKATVVTYEKGEDRVLYQYRLTDGVIEKIGTEVEDWAVSEDGTKIYYLNTEGGLYVQYEEESKEKIDSDVTELTFATEDFETVYYQKDNALYKKTRGAEKENLVSEIDSVLRIYESGEIYYLKYEENPIPYTDYLLDDLADLGVGIRGDLGLQNQHAGLLEPLEGAVGGGFQNKAAPKGVVGIDPPEGVHGLQILGQGDGGVVVGGAGDQLENAGQDGTGLAEDDVDLACLASLGGGVNEQGILTCADDGVARLGFADLGCQGTPSFRS